MSTGIDVKSKARDMRGVKEPDLLARLIARLLLEWQGSTFLGTPLNPPESTPLSSVQGQVTEPAPIKDLQKNALVGKLEHLGHQKQADLLSGCGQSFVRLRCPSGHEKYTRIHCGREYCPACGTNWSREHKKRTMRAVKRLLWAPVLGYLVFTLPGEISTRRPDRDRLDQLNKAVRTLLQKYFITPGGVSRYHLFGNHPGTFHTHLNVLFPITNPSGKGQIDREALDRLKIDYTKIVNDIFGLKVPLCVVYYNFATKQTKMFHKIKYVMRPIVTADHFAVLNPEEVNHVISLEGWHNTRWFGELANNKHKNYLLQTQDERDEEEPIAEQDHGKCPICNEPYHFVEIVGWRSLPHKELRYINENTFVDLPTFSYLKHNQPPQKKVAWGKPAG